MNISKKEINLCFNTVRLSVMWMEWLNELIKALNPLVEKYKLKKKDIESSPSLCLLNISKTVSLLTEYMSPGKIVLS